MLQKIRKTENLHVFFWLIKDMCWMMEIKLFALFMIIPTVLMAFYIMYVLRKQIDLLVVNIAVSCWILANSFWMLSDFFTAIPKLLSLPFFIAGIICMCYYIWIAFIKKINKQALPNK